MHLVKLNITRHYQLLGTDRNIVKGPAMPTLLLNLGVFEIHVQTTPPGLLCRSPNLSDLKDITYSTFLTLIWSFFYFWGKNFVGGPFFGPRRKNWQTPGFQCFKADISEGLLLGNFTNWKRTLRLKLAYKARKRLIRTVNVRNTPWLNVHFSCLTPTPLV